MPCEILTTLKTNTHVVYPKFDSNPLYYICTLLKAINYTHCTYFCGYFFILELNECVLNTDLCEHVCNNTAGSYQCSCYTGYHANRLNMEPITSQHAIALSIGYETLTFKNIYISTSRHINMNNVIINDLWT